VPLTVYGLVPDGLTVRAQLFQLSSRLAVPFEGELDVPIAASARPGAGFVSQFELPVPLPAVNRETDFEIRFHASLPPGPPARAQLAAGQVSLRVYPADLLEPVRAWAESHSIRLEDDDGSMTRFFRDQRISLTARPGPSDLTVFAGPRSVQKRSRLPHGDSGATIVFPERETETPHLVIDRTGRGMTVNVEMRLVDRLATDPLAQKIFLEAFQHALSIDDAAPMQGVVR
jgi:hypothetical protein